MATCERCGCGYAVGWGKHFCKDQLPEQPEVFDQCDKQKDGSLVAKCDYHDRRAWLELVTSPARPPLILDRDWRPKAAAYRKEAEARAFVAQTEEALRKASV